MRRAGPACLVVSLAWACHGCDDRAPADDENPAVDAAADATPVAVDSGPPEPCPDGVAQLYAPFEASELHSFPDDILTENDPTSDTGVRLRASDEMFPWLADLPALFQPAATQLDGLTGFSAVGALFLRFDGPLAAPPSGATESMETPALLLIDVAAEPPTRVPYRARLRDAGRALYVEPLRPLRLGHRHLLVMTRRYPAAEAACIRPSEFMAQTLAGGDLPARQAHLATRLGDALTTAGVAREDVAAATVFTTQTDLDVMYAVARDIAERQYTWRSRPQCDDDGPMLYCLGTFKVWDYRAERQIEGPRPSGQHTIPVHVWLPKNAQGPVPIIVYAHGLNDRAASGRFLLDDVAALGFAMVATDALYHGDHPTGAEEDTLPALRFLGLDIGRFELDPMVLRGSFNQTTAERLQLLQFIRANPDLDDDGRDDVDVSQIGYYGVSLGGMLGPSLLALDAGVGAAVLSVAGGRLLDFATGTGQVVAFRPIIEDLAGGAERLERLLPVAQTLVDAADPATYGAHVLHARRDGATTRPEVLMPVAVEDNTVPPSTAKALARALGLRHIEPVSDAVELLEVVDAPFQGPESDTPDTAGFFQYDRVSRGNGVRPASHGNLPGSPEGRAQSNHFFRTWHRLGDAEIIDPYTELETPAL